MSGRNLALRRINKDMKEITQNPIEGIGICSLEGDPMKYVVNIMLMNGPYKGYWVQLYLTLPDSYPSKPPKILIYPNLVPLLSWISILMKMDKASKNSASTYSIMISCPPKKKILVGIQVIQ